MLTKRWKGPRNMVLAALVAVMVLATPAAIDMTRPAAVQAAASTWSEPPTNGSTPTHASLASTGISIGTPDSKTLPASNGTTNKTGDGPVIRPLVWLWLGGVLLVFASASLATYAIMLYLTCGRWWRC